MRHGKASVFVIGVLVTASLGLTAACGSKSSGGGTDGGKADAQGDSSVPPGTDATSGGDTGTAPPGSDSGTPGGDSGAPGSDSGIPPGDTGSADTAPPPVVGVIQHHNDGYRDGRYVDDIFTSGDAGAASTTHLITSFAGDLTGNVYAQPLWVENGPGGNEAFIVATESNHVTAIGASGATVWDQSYGPPVPLNKLPCGNINPLGISGTPYIDVASRTIYFDEMTSPDNNVTLKHMIYAVSLDDGSVRTGWPVDVSATLTTFDSSHQNERGALQLLNGVLYVPYGGHDGDCDPYFGWVVGVPITASGPGTPTGWHTTASRGGIWGAGSLPTDGTSIFPVTGNTSGTTTWGGGEAVLRLGAGPTFSGAKADYYTPSNWNDLDNDDLDLGGANDFLLDMPGAPYPHLVVAPGKDQNLYLLNRDSLGGIGAELSKTQVASGELNAAGATFQTASGTYVALHVAVNSSGFGCPDGNTGNLVVAKITAGSPPTAAVVWCAPDQGLGSPIVTTTDGSSDPIVWDANGTLWAYDGETGQKLFSGANTQMAMGMQYFNTPIDTKGRIAVATAQRLYIFTP